MFSNEDDVRSVERMNTAPRRRRVDELMGATATKHPTEEFTKIDKFIFICQKVYILKQLNG